MAVFPIPFEVRMSLTLTQIAQGAKYALATHEKKEPMDQVNIQHVTLDWLIRHKQESDFLNGTFKEPLFVDNGSNYQNYQGADQVTYNERDPVEWTDFNYYSAHDGFWFDEDRLIRAGIQLSDDPEAVATKAERGALINLLGQAYRGLKTGYQAAMAFELLRDGSQSSKACPGISHIVRADPTLGTVGGLNAADLGYWRNNANIDIVAADVVVEMQATWDDCIRYGGYTPDFIPCGKAFMDNYRVQANAMVNRQVQNTKGGVTIDPSTGTLFFHGVPLVWDPTFDALDDQFGTTTWTKTCLFLRKGGIVLRPVRGQWMRNRKPEKLPDRYVTYFAKTSKYGLTSDKRNSLGFLRLA
jgi:hypothetical protein